MRVLQFAILSLALASSAIAAPKLPETLKFTGLDRKEKVYSPKDFQKIKETTLTIDSNPAYGGLKKIYRGYDFFDFLKLAAPSLDSKSKFEIEVTTHDGWTGPAYSSDLLRSGQALLAIAETEESLKKPVSEDGKWSMVVTPDSTLYPGPYYLVWNDKGKNPDTMPLQVATIKIVKPKAKK